MMKPVKAAKPRVHTNPSTNFAPELGPELDWGMRRTEEMRRRRTELIIGGVNF